MQELLGCAVLILGVLAVAVLLGAVIANMRKDANHGSSGGLGNALLEVQSLLEPDKAHAVEEMRREDREEETAGDPPEK